MYPRMKRGIDSMRVILHMGDPYPNESPAAKRIRAFYDVLTEHGHHVTVIAPDYRDEKIEVAGTIFCPTIRMKKKTTLMRMMNQLSFAFSSVLYARKAGKADVVLTTSPPVLISMGGWLIAKMKRAKLVYDVRDIWPDVALEMGSFSEGSLFCKIFAFIRDFMLKHSDLVTAVSPGKVEKLKKYAPDADVVFVTNGLDEHFLENEYHPETVEKYGLNSGYNCVYIGNLGWAQGLMQLMHLAERAKGEGLDARFVLFGSGTEEDDLRKYAEDRKLDNVVFAGRLPNAEMFTVLKAAQLSFVSLVNEKLKDSVPTKMFEALGVGCPVLLSAAGDSADILNACKLGIAVQPNRDDDLWNAFMELYSNLDQYLQHRENARNVIMNRYSRQQAAVVLEKHLERLITNGSHNTVR